MDNQDPSLFEAQSGAPAVAPHGYPGGKGSTLVITDLLHTSRQLSEALTPVAPSATFRTELHDDLVLAARRLYARRILTGDLPSEPSLSLDASQGRAGFGLITGYLPSRRAVWSAAAVGLGSAVSVISVMAAYYWRRRGRREDDDPGVSAEETRRAA